MPTLPTPTSPDGATGDRAPAAEARLTAYLDAVGLDWELGGRAGEYVVTLPGEKKLKTVVSVLVRDRTTSLSAFVIRNPDENHEAFYRTLLRKNLRLQGVAYAIDTDGDVYLRGELPTVGARGGAPRPAARRRPDRQRRRLQRAARPRLPRVDEEGVGLAGVAGGVDPQPRRLPTPAGRHLSGVSPLARLARMTYTLVLVRHGESDWNAKNLFTGWVDVDLTDKGRAEAVRAGQQLKEAGILPDIVHTSVQRRAITTANLSLDAADRHWIPVKRDWRLNERHYGALQGKNKKQTLEEFGEEQFMLWRRSYDVPPPPIDEDDEFAQTGDPRYAGLGAAMPRTECLKDVVHADDALLGERDPERPRRRPDRHGRRPRQLAACPRQDARRASPTTTSPGSTSRPACRSSTSSTTTSRR